MKIYNVNYVPSQWRVVLLWYHIFWQSSIQRGRHTQLCIITSLKWIIKICSNFYTRPVKLLSTHPIHIVVWGNSPFKGIIMIHCVCVPAAVSWPWRLACFWRSRIHITHHAMLLWHRKKYPLAPNLHIKLEAPHFRTNLSSYLLRQFQYVLLQKLWNRGNWCISVYSLTQNTELSLVIRRFKCICTKKKKHFLICERDTFPKSINGSERTLDI